MNITVLIKQVPDLVEELIVDSSGRALARDWLRFIINEFDEHALEQAVILKEKYGGQVTVLALDAEGIDDLLYAASARGADRVIKLTGETDGDVDNHALSKAICPEVQSLSPDLILTGVQANNDLDGSIGPLMAAYLEMPYVGYISGVAVENKFGTVLKEYPGGLLAEMQIRLPAVLGIQAAEQPPRYVAISKIRQAMNTTTIDERRLAVLGALEDSLIDRMYPPEMGKRAKMIEGDEEEIAARLMEIFRDAGFI